MPYQVFALKAENDLCIFKFAHFVQSEHSNTFLSHVTDKVVLESLVGRKWSGWCSSSQYLLCRFKKDVELIVIGPSILFVRSEYK